MKSFDPTGRIDLLLKGMLEKGVRDHGNPAIRVGMKVLDSQLGEALLETFGPGTPAGTWAEKLTKAVSEMKAEDAKR